MTFIISDHRFREHETFFQAQGELARLRALHPDRDFEIYQVRRVPRGVAHGTKPAHGRKSDGHTDHSPSNPIPSTRGQP
jgi:hypothetical protein